jgi:hypothetical protein
MGMNISIFNHQLCTLPKSVWHLSVKSISDWKNNYEPECDGCSVKDRCGGFFTTSNGKKVLELRRNNPSMATVIGSPLRLAIQMIAYGI